jgi:hypothetical protein
MVPSEVQGVKFLGRRLAKKYFEKNKMSAAMSTQQLWTKRFVSLANKLSVSILRKYFGVRFVSGEQIARDLIEWRGTSQILLDMKRIKRRVESVQGSPWKLFTFADPQWSKSHTVRPRKYPRLPPEKREKMEKLDLDH